MNTGTPIPDPVSELETYARAESLLAQGRPDEARELLEELVRAGSVMWQVYNDLGVLSFERGDPGATAYLIQASSLELRSTQSLRNLVTAHFAAKQFGEGLAAIAQLARLDRADDTLPATILDLLAALPARLGELSWLSPNIVRLQEELAAANSRTAELSYQRKTTATNPSIPWRWSRLHLPTYGQSHCCPICGDTEAGFAPLPEMFAERARRYGYSSFGAGETINLKEYSCRQCGASDRERLFALFVRQMLLDLPAGARPRMLHFAPEAALSRWIRERNAFDYVTADLKMDGVDHQLDITDMGIFPDQSFDCFICSHVMEHVQNDRQAMRELCRILKNDGWGILMAPVHPHLEQTVEDPAATSDADRIRLFGQGDHVRLYAKHDYVKRMEESGFVVRSLGIGHFGADLLQTAAITAASILYVVGKSSVPA
ncbi:MAG: methyltransferase domain-containing protein [Rhodocyclales bacterium]|nr:methyltransferase domain-containing protein [Rhodocyclales bacterium]